MAQNHNCTLSGTIKDKLFCWSNKPALPSPEQQQAAFLFDTRGRDLLQILLSTAGTAVQSTLPGVMAVAAIISVQQNLHFCPSFST